MKKRIVLLVSVLCLLIAFPIILGSCTPSDEHQFSKDWASDDTYHWHPDICGHEDQVSDKAKHSWDKGTANAEGTLYTCTVCGKTKTEKAPEGSHEHAWEKKEVVAPTCTEKGYTTYVCSCGETRTGDETAALNHTWEKTGTVEATCTEKGYTNYACACGETRVADEVAPLGHRITTLTANGDGTHTGYCEREKGNVTSSCTYTTTVTEPLCTEQGYTTYTCTCGHTYRDNYTDARGHIFSITPTYNDVYHWNAPLCSHTDEKLNLAAHEYTEVVTAPTCTEQGYTTYSCACGYSYKGEYVAALGHAVESWVEGATTVYDASLCKSAVLYRGECATCHKEQTKTEYVEKHSFYWEITTPATCVASGVKTKLCNNEGCRYHTASTASETSTYSDSNAHTWQTDALQSSGAVTVYRCANHQSVTKSVMSATDSSVNLSGSVLENVTELEFPEASLGLDSGIKDKLAANSDVSISAGKLGETAKQQAIAGANLSDEDLALLGNNPIYNFTITAGTEISELGGTATVRIPYTLTPGQNPEQIVVWYIADGKLEAVKATYSTDTEGNGYVTFTTTHFSCYVPAELSAEKYCEIYGHSTEVLTVPPTCTELGYTICLHCGKQTESVAPTGHNLHSSVTKAPTCDANGTMHFSCDGCDVAYDTVIPATGHYYILHDHKKATCQEAGSETYRCVYCEDEYSLSIKQLSHSHTATVVEPTCTSAGYTQKFCKACGDTVTVDYRQPLDHSYSADWSGAEEGHYHVCSVCGKRGEVEKHQAGSHATEQSAQICTVCEYVITPPIAHTHKLTKVEATTPDCTHGGNLAYYTCECGKWFLDADAQKLVVDHTSVYLLAKGHTPATLDPVTPTCEEVGYTAGIECSVCHDILKGHDEIAPYGHSYVAKVTAPTCTEGGYTDYTCACGDSYRDNETEALEHSYLSAVTAPTCEAGGFTTHTCTRCASSYVDAQTEKLGHSLSMTLSFDEKEHWIACTRCGTKTQTGAHTPDFTEATVEHGITCTLCGYEIKEALPHTHTPAKTVNGKAPTCTSSGVKTYYICACGKWFEDEACQKQITDLSPLVIPALGHTVERVDATESTCTAHGYTAGERCATCGTWLSGHEKLPLAEHTYQDNVCTACGIKHIAYTYTLKSDTMSLLYEFFGNGTVRGYIETVNADGTTKTEEAFADWTLKDGVISITTGGKVVASFTVAEDGETLTPVETGEDNPNKVIRYTYTTVQQGMDLRYEFYTDGTIYAKITDQTSGKTMEDWAAWQTNGEYVEIVFEGKVVEQFIVNKDDKTLSPSENCLHRSTSTSSREATCTETGYKKKVCTDCGETLIDETYPALGHDYDENGDCKRCSQTPTVPEKVILYVFEGLVNEQRLSLTLYTDFSFKGTTTSSENNTSLMISGTWQQATDGVITLVAGRLGKLSFTVNEDKKTLSMVTEGTTDPDQPVDPKPEDPVDPEPEDPADPTDPIRYLYENVIDGMEIYYEFRTDGVLAAKITDPATGKTVENEAKWNLNGNIVEVIYDGEVVQKFTVNDDDRTLTLVEEPADGCSHRSQISGGREATCTEGGFKETICADCKVILAREDYPALGHEYGEDGICIRCEGSEDDSNEDEEKAFAILVEETVNRCVDEWNHLLEMGVSASSIKMYETVYRMIIENMKNADSVEALEAQKIEFQNIVDKLMKDAGIVGPSEPDTEPVMVYSYQDDRYSFIFYKNGTVEIDITEYAADGTSATWHFSESWTEADGCVSATADGKTYSFKVIDGKDLMLDSIEESGDQLPDTTCKHEKIEYYDRFEPTCSNSGYTKGKCLVCGESVEEELPPTGKHEYQDGACVNCGQSENTDSEKDVELMKAELEKRVMSQWNAYASDPNLQNQASVLKRYESTYKKLLDSLSQASTVEEIEDYSNEFDNLFKKLENMLGAITPTVCAHKNSTVVTEQAATCVTSGYREYVCNDCGMRWNESLGFGDHELDERGCCQNCDHCSHLSASASDSMQATCTQSGMRTYSCDVCGKSWDEITPRIEHELDDKGFCSMCGTPQKKTVYNVTIWNNTGDAYQQYYFYEDHTCYGFLANKGASGEFAVDSQLDFTWESDGKTVTLLLDGKAIGTLTILADGTLEPNMGSDEETPDVDVKPDEPGVEDPELPDVGEDGEIVPPAETLKTVYFFKEIIDGQTVQIEFYSNNTAEIEIHIPCEDGTSEMLTTKGDWFAADGKVYLKFDGSEAVFNLTDGKLTLDTIQDGGNTDVPGVEEPNPDLPDVEDPVIPDDSTGEGTTPEIKYDFGGEEVNILLSSIQTVNWDMFSDNTSGSFIDQQIFERNCSIEEELNVCLNFHYVLPNQFGQQLAVMEAAGEDLYDFVSFNALQTTQTITKGYYKNLRNSDYIDIDAPWWNANYNATAGLFGAQYTLVGDLNLATYDALGVVLFNHDIMNEFGIDDLYEVVMRGEWTAERLREYAELVYSDLDGDGTANAADRFGAVATRYGGANLFLGSSGIPLLVYDEANKTMSAELDDRAVDLMDQLIDFWKRDTNTFLAQTPDELSTILADGRTLFAISTLRNASKETWEYGILPMPKFDEEQESYISSTDTTYTVIAVLDDCEMVGVTLDAMGAYNHENLMKPYEEFVMRSYYDSPEARKMFSIITENVAWDFRTVYDGTIGNATNALWMTPFNNEQPFVSSFRMNEATINKQVQHLLVFLEK